MSEWRGRLRWGSHRSSTAARTTSTSPRSGGSRPRAVRDPGADLDRFVVHARPEPQHRLRGRLGVGGAGQLFTEAQATTCWPSSARTPGTSSRRPRSPTATRSCGSPAGSNNVDQGAKVADALDQGGESQGRRRQGQRPSDRPGAPTSRDRPGNSLIVFLVLIAVYIACSWRRRWPSAALVAVIHDVILTVGVYSVFQIEVTPATVISFLTILGLLPLRHDRRVRPGEGERGPVRPHRVSTPTPRSCGVR